MSQETEPRTSGTLLLRLRDLDNQSAWEEFLDHYGPRIFAWAKNRGLQESDATDITQEVLARFIQAIRSFEYDPRKGSFRGWLKTVTHNTIATFQKSNSKPGRGSGDSQIQRILNSIEGEEAIDSLAQLLEKEMEYELLREAEDRVQLRVHPKTWLAYTLSVRDQLSAAEVSQKLDISVSEVYVSKSRVIKQLKEEVRKLD
ncbi:MAG: sigma-70 family RNA polymerase sigma factor [Planctomycetaceae bacterium]|nr:sigma-70 family RNA polymerase sigma factor [Planctomycetaceae bacterium]